MFISVLLPLPDAPMIATYSPRSITKLTPRSACTAVVAGRRRSWRCARTAMIGRRAAARDRAAVITRPGPTKPPPTRRRRRAAAAAEAGAVPVPVVPPPANVVVGRMTTVPAVSPLRISVVLSP